MLNVTIVEPDGSRRHYLHRGNNTGFDANGSPTHYSSVMLESTELVELKAKMREIMDSLPVAVFEFNDRSEMTFCNQEFANMAGCRVEDLISFNY